MSQTFLARKAVTANSEDVPAAEDILEDKKRILRALEGFGTDSDVFEALAKMSEEELLAQFQDYWKIRR